jgi:transposase
MFEPATALELNEGQRKQLESLIQSGNTPQKVVFRARIALLAGEGTPNNAIAKQLGTSRPTVILWRERFARFGVLGIVRDAKRHGREKRISTQVVKQVVEKTLHTTPKGATHWSTRTMAKTMSLSHQAVHRIWKQHGLQPHRVKTFKLSKDKRFVEKLTDVVGVYLDPPDKAVILCVDEKTQIQALDRTQPGLPIKKGRCGTMTHDYKRNGTTCLFAALNVLEGSVIGSCYQRHRNGEFLKFLRKIDREVPRELDIHMILDNYGTHNHPNVKAWLSKHPRYHLHFTPTSSSWLNLVERWFGEITRKRIRRGVFKSVPALVMAIEEYIEVNNVDPKPFVWTKRVDVILEKVNHCKAISGTLH